MRKKTRDQACAERRQEHDAIDADADLSRPRRPPMISGNRCTDHIATSRPHDAAGA